MWHSNLFITNPIKHFFTSYILILSHDHEQEFSDYDGQFLKTIPLKTKPAERLKNNEFLKTKLKIILFWNSWNYFGPLLGNAPFVDSQCPITSCIFTFDQSLINQSDVVVFYIQTMTSFPTNRNSHQRFVLFQLETPTTDNLPRVLDDFRVTHKYFNWTMTYRWDSDIVYRGDYGYIVEKSAISSSGIRSRQLKDWSFKIGKTPNSHKAKSRERKNATSMENIVKRKTKLVAWFVSHCVTPIRREEYVYQLRQYIPIDIFGACNNRDCPYDCNEMLSNDYKFYLAFENSWCPDYVTEKFYRPLMHNTVPIVMGGADYNRFAPPDSYINARDYDSPKKLAEYILFLNNTDSLYIRYFEWKKHFDILLPDHYGLCDLCRMAHDTTAPSKIYSDIKKWWIDGGGCENNTTKYF